MPVFCHLRGKIAILCSLIATPKYLASLVCLAQGLREIWLACQRVLATGEGQEIMQAALRSVLALSTIATGLVVAAPLAAQDNDASAVETPAIVAGLFACREIADDAERLACFDREVGTIQEKQQRKEIVIADKEEVRETRRGLFGFSLPKIGLFSSDDDEDEVDSLETTIVSARKMSNGRLSFEVEGGGRWIQTDNTAVLRDPKPGDTVEIKKGAVGSFMAKIGKARAFRAKRVD